MNLQLNGNRVELEGERPTIADLIRRYPPNHRAYAVEVNAHVIPRKEHAAHELRPNDVVEVVTLVGGG